MASEIDTRNCDCMDLMSEFPDKHFELAIVDPPYFDGPDREFYYGGGWSGVGVKRPDYKGMTNWKVPDESYFKELFRVSENQIIWGVNYFPINTVNAGRIVWDKRNDHSNFSDSEIAYCSLNNRVDIFRFMWNGMIQGRNRVAGCIAQGNKLLNETRIHSTQKPVELYMWLLENYAKEGDLILDTHNGSGSIDIACHKLGFNLVSSEIDTEMYEESRKRFLKETAQQSLFY